VAAVFDRLRRRKQTLGELGAEHDRKVIQATPTTQMEFDLVKELISENIGATLKALRKRGGEQRVTWKYKSIPWKGKALRCWQIWCEERLKPCECRRICVCSDDRKIAKKDRKIDAKKDTCRCAYGCICNEESRQRVHLLENGDIVWTFGEFDEPSGMRLFTVVDTRENYSLLVGQATEEAAAVERRLEGDELERVRAKIDEKALKFLHSIINDGLTKLKNARIGT